MAALVRGDVPAIVVRGAYAPGNCRSLVARLYEQDLVDGLPRPGDSIEGRGEFERVDVGTSLGNIGGDPERFFAEAEATARLFSRLFEGIPSPVECLYDTITKVSPGKRAVTAFEPDGRRYGPAIFRCHMPHWGYPPHVDSVRKRTFRTEYQVHRFSCQLGGIILLQPPDKDTSTVDSLLFRKEWDHDTARSEGHDFGDLSGFKRDAFYAYVERGGIEKYELRLNEGDLYLFKSENVHEVPAFGGNRPRIVLATFFGYSPEEEEIFVWS